MTSDNYRISALLEIIDEHERKLKVYQNYVEEEKEHIAIHTELLIDLKKLAGLDSYNHE